MSGQCSVFGVQWWVVGGEAAVQGWGQGVA